MKKFLSYISSALMLALAFTACSPDDFSGANPNGQPTVADLVEGVDYTVEVNQETNYVTFTLNKLGCYPIWTIEGINGTKTTNGFNTQIMFAGTYSYSLKLGNRNGISDGSISGTFTIENTRFDFTEFYRKLCGEDGTKEWRISSKDPGHLGCGEPGSDGTNWWSAKPDEKADWNIYDDRVTFSVNGEYTYSPGEDGHIFVNKDVTCLGSPAQTEDYVIPVSAQTSTYELIYDPSSASEVSLVLPANTLFPYIANDVQYNSACTYYINKITDKKLDLTIQLEGISWHFILISGEDEAQEEAFDPNDVNWCGVNDAANIAVAFNTAGAMNFWWADAGWGQVGDPAFSFADGVYTITSVTNGGSEWQGQTSIVDVPVAIDASEFYDISVDIEASANVDRYTMKICQTDDDNNILFVNSGLDLARGKQTVRFAKRTATTNNEATSIDVMKWIFDFGGVPEGVEIKFSNFIIQKHNPK